MFMGIFLAYVLLSSVKPVAAVRLCLWPTLEQVFWHSLLLEKSSMTWVLCLLVATLPDS